MADPQIEHLLRRAGFGARPDELATYGAMSTTQAVDALVNYDGVPDDVDSQIGQPGYVGMTIRGPFSPQSNITDARQRWLFRMVHSDRPLQEKMTLFWHNHFATGYTKIAGALGAAEGARYLAAKASEDPGQVRGQIEMLRDNALGNFRDILVDIAKDTAMLVWLDGRTNTKAKPQENFGREIMELFTIGVGNYTEADVYAGGARVHAAGTWRGPAPRPTARSTTSSSYIAEPARHDRQDLQLPDLPRRQQDDSGARRPRRGCRTASISSTALAAHPEHGALSGDQAVPLLRHASSARST